MSEDFNVLDLFRERAKEQERPADQSEARVLKFQKMHLERINNIKQLAGRLPEAGEIMFLWTLNSFNAFTFIVYTIKHCGPIDELTFSTYSLNERIFASLMKWYDKGEIKRITLLISDSIRSRVPKIYDLLRSQAARRDLQVIYAWNHSKVILMRAGEHRFVVEGSGNFSENALYEQYIYMNDERIYDFRKECIERAADG